MDVVKERRDIVATGSPVPTADAGSARDPVPPVRTARRRELRWSDRAVRAPLGLLWLGFLTILSLPVMVWMTLLHAVVRGVQRVARALRPGAERREPTA